MPQLKIVITFNNSAVKKELADMKNASADDNTINKTSINNDMNNNRDREFNNLHKLGKKKIKR